MIDQKTVVVLIILLWITYAVRKFRSVKLLEPLLCQSFIGDAVLRVRERNDGIVVFGDENLRIRYEQHAFQGADVEVLTIGIRAFLSSGYATGVWRDGKLVSWKLRKDEVVQLLLPRQKGAAMDILRAVHKAMEKQV